MGTSDSGGSHLTGSQGASLNRDGRMLLAAEDSKEGELGACEEQKELSE